MNPWDRQEGETPKAYAAFCAYRDLGTGRSIQKLRENSEKTQGYERHLLSWSSRYSWPARAAAWDEHLDRERRAVVVESERGRALREHLETTRKMSREMLETGAAMLALARRSLKAYSQLPAESVQPTEASSLGRTGVALIQTGLDAEAHALGVETAIEGVAANG